MQKRVHDAELDLAHQRITKSASIPSCSFDTDKNLAVAKSYDIRRTTFAEEPEMQSRHAPIGNEPDGNILHLAQVSSFALLQLQTMTQSIACERFQFGDVEPDFSLNIAHRDLWTCHRRRVKLMSTEIKNQRHLKVWPHPSRFVSVWLTNTSVVTAAACVPIENYA